MSSPGGVGSARQLYLITLAAADRTMRKLRAMRMLVVDDDPSILELVTRVVGRQLADKVTLTTLADATEADQ